MIMQCKSDIFTVRIRKVTDKIFAHTALASEQGHSASGAMGLTANPPRAGEK